MIEIECKHPLYWEGKFDDKMSELFDLYYDKFGCYPDTYAHILYDSMEYEEFVKHIEKSLEVNLHLPYVMFME